MTETISGANKLAERIVSDAEADRARILAESGETIAEIQLASEKTIASKMEDYAKKRDAAVCALLDGGRTRASLDARKTALTKKRSVIDDVFLRAYTAMLALDERKRTLICENMLSSRAEAGEIVLPSKADRAGISALFAKGGFAELTLSNEDAKIDGGFLLRGKGYDKDCSFASLLNEVREGEETQVAKLLFD